MKRRKTSWKTGKIQRRKTLRSRNVLKTELGSVASPKETIVARFRRERDEALERLAANSEVLKVISSSPGDMKPVFEAMLASALRICDAKFGHILLYDGERYHAAYLHEVPSSYREFWEQHGPIRPGPNTGLARLARTKQVSHIPDLKADATYAERDPLRVVTVEQAGARSLLAVPMLKENELIGVIIIYRQELRPFTDKQIELVQNFAAQAVIAIDNTRLLSELRESLQHQTATSEILASISGAMTDTKPVFDAIVRNLLRLFGTCFATIQLLHNRIVEMSAVGGEPGVEKLVGLYPRPLDDTTAGGQAMLSRQVVQFSPIIGNPLAPPAAQQIAREVYYNSIIAAPMIRQDKVIGAIICAHREQRVFNEKEVALIRAFADQAVIAIENVRLFNEVRESLRRQTATADVLKVISRSTFDLSAVLNTLVESAARLCEADMASVPRLTGTIFDQVASYGYSPDFHEFMRRNPILPGRGTAAGRAVAEGKTIHIPDVLADPEYDYAGGQKVGGFRTLLGVPLMREGAAIGALVLGRSISRPFMPEQIELVETFADQAVIAIENVRLFEEVQARTRQVTESLEDLRTTQDRLVQTQKLASLGQLTAGIAHEMKNPLNFVNNFSVISSELIDELAQSLKGVTLSETKRGEITELMETLRGNLDKVVQHGKRADAIVKNMLQHSRESTGEHRPVDINALIEESLNLAWHGARAEKQGFEIAVERSFDPSAGEIDVFPQDIRRALLNLISNGFYAASKRRDESNGDDYEPILAASTRNLGDRVEITIRDNGTGIAPDVKEKIFNPFFTTKPTGEGTGLGLSISHDIIVKQHAGLIEVNTQPGEFTEVRVILPRSAVFV